MKMRRLNKEGITKFQEYIEQLRAGEDARYPEFLLSDENYSEALEHSVEIDSQPFETRYDMGVNLVKTMASLDMQTLLGDTGFWSWLALFWFEQLCPTGKDGSRKPREIYNYILSERYNHRPRHAVMTTYMLVKDYGEKAFVLMSKAPSVRGEIIEQLAARQFYLNCQGIIDSLHRLYFDSERKTFKRGSAGKGKGGSRRFIAFLQQIERTYDLYSLPCEALMGMLPVEYSKFLPSK